MGPADLVDLIIFFVVVFILVALFGGIVVAIVQAKRRMGLAYFILYSVVGFIFVALFGGMMAVIAVKQTIGLADFIIFHVVGFILVALFGGALGAIMQAQHDSKELAVMSLNDLEELLVNVRQKKAQMEFANPTLKWEQSPELLDLLHKEIKIMEVIKKHDDPD
jgi:hypothetical protein